MDEQEKSRSKMINTDIKVCGVCWQKEKILMMLTYFGSNVTIVDCGFVFLVLITAILKMTTYSPVKMSITL